MEGDELLENAFREAVAAIRAKRPDPAVVIELLRELDEPQPRVLAELFGLMVTTEAELKATITAGKGQREQADLLEARVEMLERFQPSGLDEIDARAAELIDSRKRLHASRIAAAEAEHAETLLAGLRAYCPRLFDLPPSTKQASRILPPNVANWVSMRRSELEIERRDGWLFSRYTEPPRPSIRPRLAAVETMQR